MEGEARTHSLTPRRTTPNVSPALVMSFPCPDCGHTFKNAAARNHHRWSQHSQIPPLTVDGKEYVVEREGDRLHCPIDQCRRSYTGRDKFMKHVKAVHGIMSESPPSPTSSSQFDIRKQRLAFTSSGKAHVLLRSLNIQSFTHLPESKMSEASGRVCGDKAQPPAASSVTSEGRPRVPAPELEDGEEILRVSCRRNEL